MLLAHGGGVPEAATIVVPLLVVGAFVVQERRNVRRLREQEPAEPVEPPSTGDPDRP
jgi:hypothetical protein